MSHQIPTGVITGKDVQKVFKLAKAKKFALPAVNVVGSNTINSVLETAKELNAPVMIQFSNGGAHFNAGKGLSNENQKAAIAGWYCRSTSYSRIGKSLWSHGNFAYRPLCKKFTSVGRWIVIGQRSTFSKNRKTAL
ncbi:MAG: class II fructose-bisphosphate aldolase [Flavobacteriaceae bacterium]